MADVQGEVVDGTPEPRPLIRWVEVVAWCRENPGRTRRFKAVHSNAPHAVRRRYPDVTVGSENHRFEDDMRVCDMWVFKPK